MHRLLTKIALTCSLASAFLLAPAQAAVIDQFIQYKTFPECHDIKVLGNIVERFNWAEEKTWQRGVYLKDIERVRERVVQGEHVSPIPRRYCKAHAQLTNGKHPTLHFLIEGGQGFAGNSFNVEFCVRGYDNWNEYDGSCRAINY